MSVYLVKVALQGAGYRIAGHVVLDGRLTGPDLERKLAPTGVFAPRGADRVVWTRWKTSKKRVCRVFDSEGQLLVRLDEVS